jgi:hypothetical protein
MEISPGFVVVVHCPLVALLATTLWPEDEGHARCASQSARRLGLGVSLRTKKRITMQPPIWRHGRPCDRRSPRTLQGIVTQILHSRLQVAPRKAKAFIDNVSRMLLKGSDNALRRFRRPCGRTEQTSA